MFTKIIELLLQEKACMDEAKELEIMEAIEAIDRKYAEQSAKIDGMLDLAGYVKPVVEEPTEEDAEVVVEEVAETGETVEDADLANEVVESTEDNVQSGVVNGSAYY